LRHLVGGAQGIVLSLWSLAPEFIRLYDGGSLSDGVPVSPDWFKYNCQNPSRMTRSFQSCSSKHAQITRSRPAPKTTLPWTAQPLCFFAVIRCLRVNPIWVIFNGLIPRLCFQLGYSHFTKQLQLEGQTGLFLSCSQNSVLTVTLPKT
jgi:hypothetical protein